LIRGCALAIANLKSSFSLTKRERNETMINKTENKAPDFIAYNVKTYGEDQSNWTRIGAAWKHQDEKG
jgi:hypothetical protein